MTRAERFWAKVNKTDTCWLWTAAKMDLGYGRFWDGKENALAHVYSMHLAGIEIPPRMVLDHACRNRLCVNPSHLRIVTRSWNATHNNVSPSSQNRDKVECKDGHPFIGNNVARILVRDRNRDWRPTRICLVCHPVFRNHPRRYLLPEDVFLDLEVAA